MKIHLIQNDDIEEFKTEKHKPKLRLLTNDVDYLNTDDSNKSVFEVAEEKAEYTFEKKYTNNFNDKIMRQILKDKNQASMCLNEWLNIKPGYEIKPEEIEEVTESYITKDWSNRETDIVYKDQKYDGVFYLIEHQTKVNYKMAKRIAEYKNEIENHYEIISINDYTLKELETKVKRNGENVILKLALINKLGKLKNEAIMLEKMRNIKITLNQIDYIASYINERVARKQGKEVAKLMIKTIEEKLEKEEEKNMLEAFVDRFLDMADEKEKKGEKRGISEGISQVAINMLKEKCDKKMIKKCTGLSDAKIKELEKTLQNA